MAATTSSSQANSASRFNMPIQIAPGASVKGLRLVLIYGENADVSGLDVGLVSKTTGDQVGLQWGLVHLNDGDFLGLQLGLWNTVQDLDGLQIGLVNLIRSGKPRGFLPIVNWNF